MEITDMIAGVKGSLAGFKIPLPINLFVTPDPLPRGATGKIPKKDIKEQIKNGTSGATVIYSQPFTRKARL